MKQKINKRIYFKMKMQLKNTLAIAFTYMFLISFNASAVEVSAEIKACNDAVNEGNAKSALAQSEAILKTNAIDYEGLLCKGRALSLQDNYVDALAAMELAANSTEDTFSQTVSYILIGNLHKKNNQTAAAVKIYKKSIELSEKKDNKTYTRMNYNLIGDAYFDAKDNNAALDSYLVGTSSARNDNERAESFQHLAKTYHALGNHDKAIEFQLKATVMQKQAGSLTDYADSTLLLGQYFFDAKEYSHAQRNYQKLAQFAKENGGDYYEAQANYRLAEAMFANGDKVGAKALLIEAEKLAKKIGAKQLVAEIEAAQKKLNI